MILRSITVSILAFPLLCVASNNITESKAIATFSANGKTFTIQRTQQVDQHLTNEYSLTSRPAPPFYVQDFKVTDKIETYGELEVIEFLEKNMGVFIDARLKEWFDKSYIPGSVNIPFTLFLKDTPERDKVLTDLGGKKSGDQWNFAQVKTILLYCNGAWCGQSPTAMQALIKIGFPEEKMKYYRGGMQSWQLAGLNVIEPGKGE
jgi:rhodanese-related sulfurtransferase